VFCGALLCFSPLHHHRTILPLHIDHMKEEFFIICIIYSRKININTIMMLASDKHLHGISNCQFNANVLS